MGRRRGKLHMQKHSDVLSTGCAKTQVSFIWNFYGTTWNNEKARHEATGVGKG